MKAHANGRLRHCFFGNYSAIIVLKFSCESDALDSLPLMGPGWKQHSETSSCLTWTGDSSTLKDCKKVLGSFGADVDKIDSLAKSVDFGEPFSVDIEFPVDDSKQLILDFE